ncbi:phosphate/sulphate permeases [Longilinea arvoryzae]|uniref:Phosphate/sulphate permeases n=1 Tax=Longilinea arvoryzae TaxID=360412 RepID=A0A0S7BFJ9_9CHLR|nr:inorganic phosphate transporter [Longilinea arvoryzae]GAP12421.1 phosphate/sulphate permeases [Longilinea arvoryzae]
MDLTLLLIIIIIVIALAFDFVNGFHDAANSIATVVSTRVLTPGQGVLWAAFFNFVAAFTFGTAVAETIGGGLIDVTKVDNFVILAGLVGAVVWDLITWVLGLPTSSSHALIGGYAGAAVVKAGFNVLIISGWVKTLAFIIIAPVLGWVLGTFFITIIYRLFKHQTPARTDRTFRHLQLLSAGLYSLGHGTNDAQKTMGIIAGVLFTVPTYRHLVSNAAGHLSIPFWIVMMAHAAIALGTMSGGWRIVHTMGSKITKLKPIGGFAAETAGAITLFTSTSMGIPVSTTHVITGAIVGVGTVHGKRAVNWHMASRIVWVWLFTIPIAALISAGVYEVILLIQHLF